jgi:HAD superfamily hydrolase (TIGR01549 family)
MNPEKGAVIFDMDGTLTRPNLDFDLMRAEMGIEASPILEAIEKMPLEQRERAEAVMHRHEAQSAATSELQPGAAEVVAAIRAAGWPVALMTRNSRASTEVFLKRHGFQFDWVRTREDGPFKPSPAPVLDICWALRREPAASCVIGDYHYDITCGKAAGAATVLLLDGSEQRPAWAEDADHVISRLGELLVHLEINKC